MAKKVLAFLFFLVFPFELEASFERIPGLMKSEVKLVEVHPFEDKIIYAGSGDSLYRRNEEGEWELVYKVPEGEINFIYPDPLEYKLLFLATDNGLIFTPDGERFSYLFRERSRPERVFCVKRIGDKVYLGTNFGLYQAEMDIYNFKRIETLPEYLEVYWIEHNSEYLFLATNRGVYRSRDFRNFERRFVVSRTEDLSLQGEERELNASIPTLLKVDLRDSRKIYLGTTDGLYLSENAGRNFRKLYLQGLPDTKVNYILQDEKVPDLVYIATQQGLFKTYPDRRVAIKVYEGLPTSNINFLSMDSKGRIYLATSLGIFVEEMDSRELKEREYQLLLSSEPNFREVQEAALEYNEVSPEKIRAWRKALKLRALMPSIDVGYDKTISYSKGDFWVGPRDWSLDFTWNLEDLIWNSYQDDVDTRSRLNTQLRIDILEEVNRLYFERRRVLLELLTQPPPDPQEYIKKKLYLEELTAALDAYTGGYFSRRLQELKKGVE